MISNFPRFVVVTALLGPVTALTPACAQPPTDSAATRRLGLGFAVDTTALPGTWWGVDSARTALPGVVRAWRDYLLVRHDPAQRSTFWSAADRARTADPDPLPSSESYLLEARPLLVEALPLVAGDPDRWVLRTVYVGGGTAAHPGLLGMERTYVIRESNSEGHARWVLASPVPYETAGWHRARVGLIEYVVHPSLRFNASRAAETAAWAESIVRRFGLADQPPVTYYQVPHLEAGYRVLGLEWALSADRVGGRASVAGRFILAADPRYAEAYRHELVHVLLHTVAGGRSAFVGEGIAYWLGGARGQPFAEMMRGLAGYLAGQPNLGLASILSRDGSGASGSAALPVAAGLFELAHRRGGDEGVRRFIETLGTGEPKLTDLARALGTTPSRLEADWRALVQSFVH